MSNERFQNAIQRKPQPIPPIWMMRQAGRYHKHYQGLRAKHSFMELCKDPELATQVTLGPIEDFDFDVAILFSDLLFPLEALGMGLSYPDTGPKLGWHLSEQTIQKLKTPAEAWRELEFQREALQTLRKRLPQDKSLIGFVGGPWTLFVYAVEGSHAGSLIESKKNLRLFDRFAEYLMPLLKKNIELQLEGGAEVVMIFDTAAGELSPALYHALVVPQLTKLAQWFPGKVGYYSKGTNVSHYAHALFVSDAFAGLGFDHRWKLTDNLKHFNGGFIQGNFDQTLLFLPKPEFQKELDRFLQPLREMAPEARAGWVCGLGHGVLPKTPEENVRHFVKYVREVFR
ncbi:MAG TPA: uroporphyrinogen decarboxylase family protein [Bdellovibrionales bacterium]|nr:uroporphyrinogen decarboxylase family protein [Bdellovibrionales bacterium]